MNFRVKEKLMLRISGRKKNLFQLNKLVQRWSFHSIYEAWILEEEGGPALHEKTKNNEVIFSLAWNISFSNNWKVLVLKFVEMKDMYFWAKNLMEIWSLLITEKFLF